MPADGESSETVVFEVGDRARAEWLCRRLRPRWHAAISEGDGRTVVAVGLRLGEGDLAALLRAVERWVVGTGLGVIRFRLDGRAYVLSATTGFGRVAA